MGANSKTVYGADGSTSLLSFYPEKLTVIIDPAHPLYDERHKLPYDEATVLNMMAFGVLEPIIVTRDTESGAVLVVDGRQRVKNATEANRRLAEQGRPLLLVPATTRKGDSPAVLMGVMVATNQLRQEDPPMVIARKMQSMKNLGVDDAAVAIAFGCNPKTVDGYLALLDCAKPVQKAIEGQFIGVTDARYLSRLTPQQQADKVAEIIRNVAGKEGHARAKAKREVLASAAPVGKPSASKMKGRREIAAMIEKFKAAPSEPALNHHVNSGWIAALEWVMGAPAEPEKDTKTRDLVDELEATK